MLLEISGLNFSYTRGALALEDINLNLQKGEVLGLIGPNGSGKSTLIKCIFDLLHKNSGDIRILGVDNSQLEAKRSGLFLSSNDNLPNFLSGAEYLELNKKLYKTTLDDSRVEDLWDRYGLTARVNHLIEDYSHGMKKKLQIVTALALSRDLTVIDETLNGIDLEALMNAEKDIKEPTSGNKSGVILCTHDFGLLERISDRIVFLWRGNILETSPTRDLIDRYGSLGEMANFILGEVS